MEHRDTPTSSRLLRHGGRLLPPLLAMLLGIGALLLLPPGPSARLASALRYVTEPAQAWSDCAARLASAFVGHTGAEAPQATEQRVLAAEQQLELNALRAAVRQLRQEVRRLGARSEETYRSHFTTAIAKVIRRDPLAAYYDHLLIDAGAVDGIKVGQYVVAVPPLDAPPTSLPSLLGVIREVSAHASSVQLMTSETFAVPCGIPSCGVTGVLTGLGTQPPDGYAIEKDISRLILANPSGHDLDRLRPGEAVYTSGLGDDPQAVPNIMVGQVTATSLSENGMPIVLLRPEAPLWNVTHVLVILGKN